MPSGAVREAQGGTTDRAHAPVAAVAAQALDLGEEAVSEVVGAGVVGAGVVGAGVVGDADK
jgi:hypothetical protein